MKAKPFSVLVADPPWLFGDKLPGKGRGAEKHYGCLSLPEIITYPLPLLTDDCWLFLWRVGAMQQEALAVAKAWGFYVTSEIVWVKANGLVGGPGDGSQMGMGRTVRNCHEVCLVCRRGKPIRSSASVRSVVVAPRLKHSQKPAEFYHAVDRLVGYDARVVELFARRQWPRWTCLGDQMEKVKGR